MHKSLFRWQLRVVVLVLCAALAFNGAAIRAQDSTPTPETPTASPEATEATAPTETPTETPTDVPTEAPTETPLPTEAATETPVITETPVASETPPETPTETPIVSETPPTTTPEPVAWVILAREAFNNGDLSAWLPGSPWVVVASSPADPNYPVAAGETDQALQVVNNPTPIQFGSLSYGNVSAEASFRVTAGSAKISVRQSATDPNVNYSAAIDAAGQVQVYRSGLAVLPAPIQAAATPDNWHTLQLSAYGNTVTLVVDKTQTASWSDPEPLFAGGITLSADFGDTAAAPDPAANVVTADNFFVYVPDAEKSLYPTPTPATPAPTESPTETPVVITPTEEVTPPPTEPPTLNGKSLEPVPPPTAEQLVGALASSNDDFPGAGLVPPQLPYVDLGNTIADSEETGEPRSTCGYNISKTVWYSFTPTVAGTYMLSTAGSNFDTILAVYTGFPVDNLSLPPVGCNDDVSAANRTSQLTLTLQTGIDYRIQVGGFNGAYGDFYFRIQQGAAAVPGAPVLTGPATGIVLNTNLPTLTWNAPLNAFTYDLQVATSAAFTPASLVPGLNINVGIVTTYTPTLPSPATYYWRVRALNLNGVPGAYSAARSIVYRTAPPAPSLPANGLTTTDTTPMFSWLTYGAGAKYNLVVSADPSFALPPQLDVANLTALNYTPTTALQLPQGVYSWHVNATDVTGLNSPTFFSSPARTLTINILSAPANNAIVTLVGAAMTSNVTFSWVAVPGATSYNLEYANSDDFLTTPVEITGITTTTRMVTLPPGQYWWHVRALPLELDYPTDALARKVTVSPPTPVAPVLVAPAASAITNDTSPLLDWNPTTTLAGGIFVYDVQLARTATFTLPIVEESLGNPGTEFTVGTGTPLTPGNYYWRVRVKNAFGVYSAYSAARLFTVKTNILSTPADNFVTADTTPGFAWMAINYPNGTPPVKYQLEVDDDPAFGGGILFTKTGLTTLSYMMVNPPDTPLANGTYYWRVQVDTGGGFEITSIPRKIIISPSIPAAPTYLAIPAAGSTFADTTPLLDFNQVTVPPTAPWFVEYYEVQIAISAAFTVPSIVQSNNTLPDHEYQATTLNAGTYYWRARAINNYGAPGTFSAARSFIIRITPPLVTAPAANAVLTTSKPLFSWPTFGIGAKYNIEIADNAGFSDPVLITNPTPLTTLTFTPPTSLKQGVWYWRIRAVDALGTISTESATRSFTIRILSLPADNAVVNLVGAATMANVTFSWVTVPGATGYTLRIDDNLVFSTPEDFPPTTPPTGLSRLVSRSAGVWYWYVIPTGFPPDSPPPAAIVRKVTVSPPAPLAPVLVAPLAGASTPDTTPLLDWNATTTTLGGTFTYDVQVCPTAACTIPIALIGATGLTATEYTVDPALLPATYYWRVRTVNIHGVAGAYSAARLLYVDTAATLKPTLTLPADKSTSTIKQPTFTWTKPTGATRFELRYSINFPLGYVSGDMLNTTGTVIIGGAGMTPLTLTSYKPPSPLLPNRYFWQVQAYDAAGNSSGWTNLFTFVITSATGDSPIPNHFGAGDPILLTWGPLSWVCTAGVGCPNGNGYYEIQVDNNITFASPEYQLTNAVGNTITYAEYIGAPPPDSVYGVIVPDGSLPNGTWYWRVRGFNPTVLPSGAYGAYSTTGTFTVEK